MGVAPVMETDVAVAINVNEGTITSSPGPIPRRRSAAMRAPDPLLHGDANSTPQYSANSPAKARLCGPVTQRPQSTVVMAASRISSVHDGRASGIRSGMFRRTNRPSRACALTHLRVAYFKTSSLSARLWCPMRSSPLLRNSHLW